MGRMVEQQRTQIGTMNALGLKRHKIMLHYISFSLVVSVVGVVLGLLAETLWEARQSLVCLQTGISCRVCIRYSIRCILSLQQALWQYAYLLPISAAGNCFILSRQRHCGRQHRRRKEMHFERLPFWKKLSFTSQYNLRIFPEPS